MDQRKYLVYAVLIILVGIGAYFIIKSLSQTKRAENSSAKIIDYDKPVDSLTKSQLDGKMLFIEKCAACHAIFKNDGDLSRLLDFTEREPWNKRQNVYDFIRNPAAFMKKNEYARNLKKIYGSMMTAFPELTNEEIDAICDYIKQVEQIRYGIPDAEK